MTDNPGAREPSVRPADAGGTASDADLAYALRLETLAAKPWKRWVPNPYRAHLRRLRPGFVLDLGCGLGRNLGYLDGRGVGVDVNLELVRRSRERGFEAFSPVEFAASPYARPGRFESLLLSHVAEHLGLEDTGALVLTYAPYVRRGGRLILITPQEAGYRSDPTHREFMDFRRLREVCRRAGFAVERTYSHPFPRPAGRFFVYNEFVCVGRAPT